MSQVYEDVRLGGQPVSPTLHFGGPVVEQQWNVDHISPTISHAVERIDTTFER